MDKNVVRFSKVINIHALKFLYNGTMLAKLYKAAIPFEGLVKII